jgi:hypothetical protein
LIHALFLVGEPADLELVYRAKNANFDCACRIEHDLLTRGSDRETMLTACHAMPARSAREREVMRETSRARSTRRPSSRGTHWSRPPARTSTATDLT